MDNQSASASVSTRVQTSISHPLTDNKQSNGDSNIRRVEFYCASYKEPTYPSSMNQTEQLKYFFSYIFGLNVVQDIMSIMNDVDIKEKNLTALWKYVPPLYDAYQKNIEMDTEIKNIIYAHDTYSYDKSIYTTHKNTPSDKQLDIIGAMKSILLNVDCQEDILNVSKSIPYLIITDLIRLGLSEYVTTIEICFANSIRNMTIQESSKLVYLLSDTSINEYIILEKCSKLSIYTRLKFIVGVNLVATYECVLSIDKYGRIYYNRSESAHNIQISSSTILWYHLVELRLFDNMIDAIDYQDTTYIKKTAEL